MPEKRAPLDIAELNLQQLEAAISARRLPPVDAWNPSHCGHSDMRIARDGTWFHDDRPIARPAMVRLFSTVLRREPDGSHVLVTPGEKLTIDVELAPFVATGMKVEGTGENQTIAFQINSGDAVLLGPDHPLRLAQGIPLIEVRSGLEASLARPVYYELADLALQVPEAPGVWSQGTFFPLVAA